MKEHIMFIINKIKNPIICVSAIGSAFAAEVGVVLKGSFPLFTQSQIQQAVPERVSVTQGFSWAMDPVLIDNQVRGSKNNLSSSEEIFDLDLSGVDFSNEEGEAILNTIKGKKFPNLRSINLHNVTSISAFLRVFFEFQNDAQLYSLISIDATGNNDIKVEDLVYLENYYEKCPHVLRDIEQYDSRREMSVSNIKVHVDKISIFSDSSYTRGSFIANDKPVYIRSEKQFKIMPFSLLVGR